MGKAKNRGPFEYRKAQAIAEGRSKKTKLVIGRQHASPKFIDHNLAMAEALMIMQLVRQHRG